MKQFHWLNIAIFFIVVSSLIPLAFSGAVQADSVKGNLKELTDAADSILVGTVTERSSYWNDEHTRIYTSVVFSLEDRIKGEAGPDKVTITVPGGEVEGLGELVSEMPSFAQGEKAVVFLKKLNKAQLPQAKSLPDKFPAQQFEVYAGFRGKFPIKGDKIDSLPVAKFKGRINSILAGQPLPAAQLDIAPPPVTMPYLVLPYSWPHPPAPVVPYRINENASSCTGEGAAVQNAAPTWSSAGANFSFSYAGTTAATAYGYDDVNEIMWVNTLDTGILAVTYIFYSGSAILENDVEFNNNYNWSTSPTCPGGYYDVQSVGLHEFGHWLCLSDLYDPADAAKVMYGYGSSGTTKRALTADDIAGIQSIYGASSSNGTQKLVGADDVTATGNNAGGYLFCDRWTAEASGTIASIKIKCGTSGNVKVAIYADNGGSPGSLLNAVNTSTPVVAGWNQIPFPSTAVTQGTTYWLASASDVYCIGYTSAGGYSQKYKPSTYSTFTFPSSAGTGFAIFAGSNIIAGWSGTTIPSAPTVTNASGASNITSNSSRLNGEITNTGGENPTVTIYWGTTDGGTTPGDWANNVNLGTKAAGTFYTDITGLSPSTTYRYRCYASNSTGDSWATSSKTFQTTATGTDKLIGADDVTATGNNAGGYLFCDRWTAEASGTIASIKIKCGTSGNVKVAIYADNGGSPGSLLNAVNTSTPVVAGWNQIPFPSTAVTQGTTYWLASASDVYCIGYTSAGGYIQKYKPSTYSTFTFPSSAGTGFAIFAGSNIIAGWGAPPAPPTPPDAPSLLSPGTSITFKWGTADRATTYWLQVNTQSDFSGTNLFNAEVGNVTTQEVTGLSLGITYYCRVKAGNASGWGPWSSVRSVLANTMP